MILPLTSYINFGNCQHLWASFINYKMSGLYQIICKFFATLKSQNFSNFKSFNAFLMCLFQFITGQNLEYFYTEFQASKVTYTYILPTKSCNSFCLISRNILWRNRGARRLPLKAVKITITPRVKTTILHNSKLMLK